MKTILILLVLLQVKHLVIDWILQPPYMWKNKGTYGHAGGVTHAAFNALGTGACFLLLTNQIAIIVVVDFLVHYHIDWAKMNINSKLKWGPTTHEEFWWLLGLDQYLHALTYIGMVALVTL